MDPLSEEADYDPQSAAICSAYVSAFNDYVRQDLHYGREASSRKSIFETWDFQHQPPAPIRRCRRQLNAMPDLANAMKYDPDLKILLTGGYFDLATPFYEGCTRCTTYRFRKLQENIEYHYYESGHMVYAHYPR